MKIGAPNAWLEAQEALSSILFNRLYQLSTSKGSEFPDLINPLRVVGGEDDRVSITPNVPIQTSRSFRRSSQNISIT